MAALLKTVRQGLERTPGGLVLPTGLLTVDPLRMREFTHMLVRGLYYHHSGEPLPQGTVLHSHMSERDTESILVDGTVRAFGPDVQRVKADLGAGVLRYEAILSTVARGASAWQIEFGQMQWLIGKNTPRSVVGRRFVATMPPAPTDEGTVPIQETVSG
ncbi:hypothetical protein ACFZ8E_19135 [Methylobacterium sp. HMF5984]|uniref:hypothetical protein n=1 Tax=Methylobacterium sp. HMF5984 TaxID=3367370 RepID=UPI0038547579